MKEQRKIPELRFPEFTGELIEKRLSEVLTRISKNNKDEEFNIDDILSLSSQYGIVDRKELLEDTYSKVNHLNYIKTRKNDLVYGKSISAKYPYGLFKSNNLRDGLLSTLYFTFKPNSKETSIFLDKYFSLSNRANNFLKKYVLVGDRYITADADYILSGKIYFPSIQEQEKITSFLSKFDKKIEKLEEKKEQWEEYKKGVMQKIFSQEIRFKDDEGNEFSEWEEKRFKEICSINQGLQIAISERYTTNENNDKYFYITNEFLKKNSDKKYYIANPPKNVICNKNDILMTRTGNTGKVVTNVEGAFHNNFFKINYSKNNIVQLFFVYLLKFDKIQNTIMKLAGTSTIPDLNHGDFYAIKYKFPSLPEQKKIADFLSNLDSKIEAIEKEIEVNKEFKKGLLQKMFC